MRRALVAVLAAATVSALLPAGAAASHHLMKVREVYVKPGDDSIGYVTLQMYAGGQNFVAGDQLLLYSETGHEKTADLTANVSGSASQSTITIATPAAETAFGFQADFDTIDSTSMTAGGGAVCFDDPDDISPPFDCMSWGNFSGQASVEGQLGANAPAPTASQALRRDISRGCATLLEAGDDTNNSAADFDLAQPNPRPNSVAPTEKVCAPPATAPDTTITQGPKKKTKSKRATFRFESDQAGATFACKLDRGGYEPCASPSKYTGLKRGKHVFRVRATAKGKTDATPAEYRWKVKRKRRR